MKIDLTSLSFNSFLEDGVGTPSWGTALGQSEGYYITSDGAEQIVLGMINNKMDETTLETNLRGEKDILLAACFDFVHINDVKINKPFILAIVEEHSKSHNGRKSLKYNDKFKGIKNDKEVSNQDFYSEAQKVIGTNTCWFGYELIIINGKNLLIKAKVVSESPQTYANSQERKKKWKKLIEGNNGFLLAKPIIKNSVIGQFVFNVLKYLVQNEIIESLQKYLLVNEDKRFCSLEKDQFKLTSIFWIFNSDPSVEQLSQGGKIRAFEEVSFISDDLFYHLSKEWTDQDGHRLDINNFIAIFNSLYKHIRIIKSSNEYVLEAVELNFTSSNFHQNVLNSGLVFSSTLIRRFLSSLCSKQFVILSGLSGSGKTKLAQAFAQWISKDDSQYEIIPVGADWTNREPLLGYPNALHENSYVKPENGALDLILRAKESYEKYLFDQSLVPKPYFLILDEMNLSHVERYFADFLSAMESGEPISLHSIKNKELNNDIPASFKLPKNLFIIGTVNIDETTYMFSPKVLDRANTIEFRMTEADLVQYIGNDNLMNMSLLTAMGADMSDDFMKLAMTPTTKGLNRVENELKLFFSELKKSGAEFGYRTAGEIGRLMIMLEFSGEFGNKLLDIAIMQKLLPKLHGSRNKLTKVLPVLGGFCLKNSFKIKEDYLEKFVKGEISEEDINADLNVKYHISFEKICRMYKNAFENGFASYAEA